MTTKLHETSAVAELKEARLRVMELETAVQVSSNQVGRQEEENKRLQDSLETSQAHVKRLQAALSEQRRKFSDLQSQMEEEKMMARIREAEKSQNLAELTQKISSLEYKNQELVTEGEVGRVSRDSEQVPPLQEKLAHLQSEVARLRAVNRQLSCNKVLPRIDYTSENDSDIEDPDDLRLILSPTTLSGDLVTLNGDLADCEGDILNTDSPDPSNCDTIKEKLHNGPAAPITNGVALSKSPNQKSCSEIGSCNSEREDDKVRRYSGSADHNHNREMTISSPLRKRSSSSECSIDSNPREPISRRTSHTLAEAFLEQLPEVRNSNST
ncbi:rab GTPase-activating protein eat-17 [Hyalella azteca]|uniref:Rab GTPase-activating protein eat-17 n=1 Tax=Hyalella azteca TaxID=294128 RepID=A0A8B7PLV0_HYAAZ|nr:rab GTPase-activating protein eat-17 [Hyalella azteca]